MEQLVLFDFDGTLTKKDSLIEIAKFSTSSSGFLINISLLLPILILMKLKLVNAQKSKELFLKRFFGHYSTKEFNDLCEKFGREIIPNILREKAMPTIKAYLEDNAKVVIVSASPENWIKPWAIKYEIQVVSTKLKFSNEKIKGIEGANCNGEEKVKRIKKAFNLDRFDKVIAYGDTKGDYPMLALADESHFKPFQ